MIARQSVRRITDGASRVVRDRIAQQLGVPIVVDNRPAAGTKIGTAAVIKATERPVHPLLDGRARHNASENRRNSRYDAECDLRPVGLGRPTTSRWLSTPAIRQRACGNSCSWRSGHEAS
ncbi:hypothetical protein FBQ73_18140 [Xanthobacter autotrophicus]|uniref:Uncharacterized protein n=1 Tax=Xanthobacter autotrophicus TaxID=280 RepID=A0A6C1KBB7_XANAU|nr:hypothetical protein FBQ73_18140 [Xanthobacter autotrophicus]